MYILNFVEISDEYTPPRVKSNNVRLTLFPFFLLGEAIIWLNSEPANSIKIFDDLARMFFIWIFFHPIK